MSETAKRCSRCGEVKSLADFHRHRRRPDGRQTYCKACKQGYGRQWYAANAEAHRRDVAEDRAAREQRNRRLVQLLKQQPCSDCGERPGAAAMDFDHVRGRKVADVSALMRAGTGRLLAEIAKCDLVCANCHRQRTRVRRRRGRLIADAGWRERE